MSTDPTTVVNPRDELYTVLREAVGHAEAARLLIANDAAVRAEDGAAREKSSRAAANATPLSFEDRERLTLLRRAVADWQGPWSTRRAQHLYAATYGPGDWRRTARRDLETLHREGLLVLHDDPANRHYTFNQRTGGGRGV